MADILPMPGAEAPPPMADLIRCVDREIGFRVRVYPRWVAAVPPKMTPSVGAREIATMRAVRARLVRAEAEHTVLSGLGMKHGYAHRHLQEMIEEAERLVASQVGSGS